MIDIHNHLIPKFDDGPRSLDESLKMLQQAAEQGVTDIFATSHFNEYIPKKLSDEYFAKLKELREMADQKNISIRIHSGGEMFYHPYLPKQVENTPMGTLGGWGQYVLMEFPMFQTFGGYEEVLFNLSINEFIPIIAHPERYVSVIESFSTVYDFVKFGGLLQLNAGSILGHFGKESQKIALRILKEELAHFIASDAHSPRGRSVLLATIADYLQDDIPAEYLDRLLTKNAEAIINKDILPKAVVPETRPKEGLLGKLRNSFKRK